MIVIDQGGRRVRQRCGYCLNLRRDGHYARPRQRNHNKRNWLCNECFAETIDESIRKHQEQIENGVPFEDSYFEWPNDLLRFVDEHWIDEIRRRSPPHPNLSSSPRPAKKDPPWLIEATRLITRSAA